MYNRIILSLVFMFSITFAFCQTDKQVDEFRNKGYFNITKISYIAVTSAKLETFNPNDGGVVTDLPIDNASAYSLQTINGIFLSPHFSVGLGIGLEGYSNPNFNTLPAFLDLRYYFNDDSNSFYTYLDYGTMIKLNDINNGTTANIGIGYKLPLNSERLMIIADLGYSYKSISNDGLSIRKSESWTQVKGFIFGIGIIL